MYPFRFRSHTPVYIIKQPLGACLYVILINNIKYYIGNILIIFTCGSWLVELGTGDGEVGGW